MQLGADEGEPFLQLVALVGAIGGGEVFLGCLVGNVLHDGRAFVQAATVVERQEGHIAQRVDSIVVAAIGQLVGLGGCHDGFEGQTGLVHRDVWGQGAGAGGVVELHGMEWTVGKREMQITMLPANGFVCSMGWRYSDISN